MGLEKCGAKIVHLRKIRTALQALRLSSGSAMPPPSPAAGEQPCRKPQPQPTSAQPADSLPPPPPPPPPPSPPPPPQSPQHMPGSLLEFLMSRSQEPAAGASAGPGKPLRPSDAEVLAMAIKHREEIASLSQEERTGLCAALTGFAPSALAEGEGTESLPRSLPHSAESSEPSPCNPTMQLFTESPERQGVPDFVELGPKLEQRTPRAGGGGKGRRRRSSRRSGGDEAGKTSSREQRRDRSGSGRGSSGSSGGNRGSHVNGGSNRQLKPSDGNLTRRSSGDGKLTRRSSGSSGTLVRRSSNDSSARKRKGKTSRRNRESAPHRLHTLCRSRHRRRRSQACTPLC